MKVDFSDLFTPRHEMIRIDGCPFKIGSKNSVQAEDSRMKISFYEDGSANLFLKSYPDPNIRYRAHNDFMMHMFADTVNLSVEENDDGTRFLGYIQGSVVITNDDGSQFTRTMYVENSLYKYNNGEMENAGINIYYIDVPVRNKNKKKKK